MNLLKKLELDGKVNFERTGLGDDFPRISQTEFGALIIVHVKIDNIKHSSSTTVMQMTLAAVMSVPTDLVEFSDFF